MDPLKKVIQSDQVRDYYFGSTIPLNNEDNFLWNLLILHLKPMT